jgi:hypothetical protein
MPSFTGKHEDTICNIASGLRDFTAGVAGDERGLVQAFGVFVTMMHPSYYNRIQYDTLRKLEEKNPRIAAVGEALFRESGHVCVFNTFGGILQSPEWEGMVETVTSDPEKIITFCTAIGRALGFGHWTIQDFTPGERLVLRTPSTYESAYFRAREGTSEHGICYFLQGAAVGLMQLAHYVKWEERPQLTQDYYDKLFKKGQKWQVRETSCIGRGDPYCEVVVTKA